MKKIFLFLFAVLLIVIVFYLIYKYRNKKEKFSTTKLGHTTYYANWAQFWPNGPQDSTDNQNVNSPYAIAGSLGNVDTIIYGITLFGIMPNPTLGCQFTLWGLSGSYNCWYTASVSDSLKTMWQSCLSYEQSSIVGDGEDEILVAILGEETTEAIDLFQDIVDQIETLVDQIEGDSPPTYFSDNNAFLTYPMYPNECFTGCGINFDDFYWTTSGTDSKCCSLYRISDPYCFNQLRSLNKTLLASYGGWTYTHGGADFSSISQNMFTSMISTPDTRKRFLNASGNTLTLWGFQGADFDWEYPGSASAGAVITTTLGYTSTTDFYNFECLIREYRAAFPNFILSMQCSGFLSGDAHYSGPLDGYFQNGETVYMATDSDYFSWINRLFTAGLSRVHFMAYDYFVAGGQPYTMPNTPLYCPNQELNTAPWPGCGGNTTSSFNSSYPWINPTLSIADYQNTIPIQESFTYVSCGTVSAGNTVKNGFTLNSISNIAAAYGVPPQAVVDATNALQSSTLPQLTSTSELQAGQILYIPCNNSSVPVCGTGQWPSGFGLAQLAEKSNVTVNSFENANPLFVQYANNVQIGNSYNIPCNDTTPQSGNVCPAYILTQGSYYDLATAIGANVEDVVNLNASTPPSSLVINQNVNVPCVNNMCPSVYYALPGDSLQSIFTKLFPKVDLTSASGKQMYNAYLQSNTSISSQPQKLLSTNPQSKVNIPCISPKSIPAPAVPPSTQLDFQGSNNTATVQYCILKSMVLMSQIFGDNISKVHLGLAMYGRSYKNVNFLGMTGDELIQNSVGLPSTDAMWGGSYTQTPGVMSFYEIQQLLQQKDSNGNNLYISGYNQKYGINIALSLENNTWISYDDFDAIQEKMNYAKCLGFGGVMTFTPQQDDFSKGFPLMNYVNNNL